MSTFFIFSFWLLKFQEIWNAVLVAAYREGLKLYPFVNILYKGTTAFVLLIPLSPVQSLLHRSVIKGVPAIFISIAFLGLLCPCFFFSLVFVIFKGDLVAIFEWLCNLSFPTSHRSSSIGLSHSFVHQ